jgi:hypothetical protein
VSQSKSRRSKASIDLNGGGTKFSLTGTRVRLRGRRRRGRRARDWKTLDDGAWRRLDWRAAAKQLTDRQESIATPLQRWDDLPQRLACCGRVFPGL